MGSNCFLYFLVAVVTMVLRMEVSGMLRVSIIDAVFMVFSKHSY